MFLNANSFKDEHGNTTSDAETDYLLTAFAISWRPDLQLLGGDYMAVITPSFGNIIELADVPNPQENPTMLPGVGSLGEFGG